MFCDHCSTTVFRMALLLAACAGAGCDQEADRAAIQEESTEVPAGATPPTVDTVVARQVDSLERRHAFTGTVKAQHASELSLLHPGRVVEVLVSEGEVVQAGDMLVRLDTSRLERKQSHLEQARSAAQAALDALTAEDRTTESEPNTSEQTDTASAAGRLENENPPAESDVAAGGTVEELRARIGQLRAQLDQLEARLPEAGSETTSPPDVLSRQLASLEQRVADLRAASRAEAQEQLRADSRSRVRELQRRIAELDAELADLELELRGHALQAAFDGVIAQCHVAKGAVVSAGMPLVRLVDPSKLQVWVDIPAEQAAQRASGADWTVTVSEQPCRAQLVARLPQIEPTTRTRTVILDLTDAAANRVLPGDVARIELATQSQASGFWLPRSALTREPQGLWSVLVLEPEVPASAESARAETRKVARRLVEVLHIEASRVFLRGMLDDGERVIVDGTHRIVPGQQVQFRDRPAGMNEEPAR